MAMLALFWLPLALELWPLTVGVAAHALRAARAVGAMTDLDPPRLVPPCTAARRPRGPPLDHAAVGESTPTSLNVRVDRVHREHAHPRAGRRSDVILRLTATSSSWTHALGRASSTDGTRHPDRRRARARGSDTIYDNGPSRSSPITRATAPSAGSSSAEDLDAYASARTCTYVASATIGLSIIRRCVSTDLVLAAIEWAVSSAPSSDRVGIPGIRLEEPHRNAR